MNFVERYMKFAEPLTEAPRTFHFYMAYVILSQVIGRRLYYEGAGSFPLSPNLWVVLIGASSITKKSTTLRIATDHVMRHIFADEFRVAAEGSHEGFMEDLEKKPSCLIAHAEFANLMGWLNKDYNASLLGALTDLYDQPLVYRRRVGTRKDARTYEIKEPFINIATCSTIDWFNKSIKEDAVTGGFLPRFNIVIEKADTKDIPQTPPIDKGLQADLIHELSGILAQHQTPRAIRYAKPALDLYCAWYIDFKKKLRAANYMAIPFYSRRMSDLHKFAMLNAVMRGANEMNIDDLENAFGIVEQICEYTDELMGQKIAFTPFQADRKKVLEIIERMGNSNGGAQHSQVLKASKMKIRDFNEIILGLKEDESIQVSDSRTVAGKKITHYKIQEGE